MHRPRRLLSPTAPGQVNLCNTTILRGEQHVVGGTRMSQGFQLHAMQRMTGRKFARKFKQERISLTRTEFFPRFQELDLRRSHGEHSSFGPKQPTSFPGTMASLTLPACPPTLIAMEVHFSPDVETRLHEVASANGKDAEQLVKDTVNRMLENQARFIAGVQLGIEQADRGELVEHNEVLNRSR
jgi:predicted transcriptional regulator